MKFWRVEGGVRRETREGMAEEALEGRCCGSETEEGGGEEKEGGRFERWV